jgi:PAS domain-containing protein
MSKPTTAAPQTRPAQLATTRVGAGKVVHLGHLSSQKGPNGEPRYVSWCPASQGRDGAITVGEALTEQIICRRCLRSGPAEAIQRANEHASQLAQRGTSSVVLPHTGMRVPHARMTVRKLRFIPTMDGEAYGGELLLDGRPIGVVENHGCGDPTTWSPFNRAAFGWKDMAAFVAACRDADGEELHEEFVLAELVEETRTARDVARYLRAGRLPVRTLAAIVTGDEDEVIETYPTSYIGVAGDWTDRREQLTAMAWRTWPEAYAIEMWTGQEWAPLTAPNRR